MEKHPIENEKPQPHTRESIPLYTENPLGSYNHTRFKQALEQRGFRIIEDQELRGDRLVSTEITPGDYILATGFTRLSLDDRRYLYGNNPKEEQNRPLILDTDHPSFQNLYRQFRNEIIRNKSGKSEAEFDKIATLVRSLDAVVGKQLVSSSEDENVRTLSEIIASGKSACAGKVLVSGLILRAYFQEHDRSSDVQAIGGRSFKVKHRRRAPHDIHHVWLRIALGDTVALYDPYYKKQSFYQCLEGGNISAPKDDHFSRYDVNAYEVAKIHGNVPLDSISGIKLAEVTREGKTKLEAYMDDDLGYLAQIKGVKEIGFSAKGNGILKFVNGSFEFAQGITRDNYARYLEPVIELRRNPR